MRSAHGAGFLYALATKLHITNPDMVIGSSGNAANLLYYATQKEEQCEAMKRIWTELLSTLKFISKSRIWRMMDIDYLIDSVFKKQAVFDVDALQKSSIEYHIAIVDAYYGKPRFINKHDGIDPFELLRATKALPFFYGKKVMLQGKEYIDGAVGHTVQEHIDFAVQRGATRVLVIDDSSRKSPKVKLKLWLYALCTPSGLRKRITAAIFKEPTHTVPEGVRLVYVQKNTLPTSVLGRDRAKLRETFEAGVSDAISMALELKLLFGK